MSGGFLLFLLVLFQLKHLLADYAWQTTEMVANKGSYGHKGGMKHAGLHAALSTPVLALAAPGLLWIVVLAVAEMVVHYHIDWLKARAVDRSGTGPRDARYWLLTGLDQAAHQLTYIAMAAALLILS